MCSRFSITSPPEAVRAYFGYFTNPNFPPRYNIAPTQPIPIVRAGANNARELVLARWGLIPSWVKDPNDFMTLINARSETAASKPSFRSAMKHGRCLIPMDGFYEWMGPKGHKRAYFIKPGKEGPLAFAGLWEHWLGSEGSEIESAAILTISSNEKIGRIHDRCPVIINPDDFETWLDCKTYSAKEALTLLAPPPEDLFEVVEVSTKVNNPGNDFAEVQEPLQREMF